MSLGKATVSLIPRAVTKHFLRKKMLQIKAPYSVYPFEFFLDFIKTSRMVLALKRRAAGQGEAPFDRGFAKAVHAQGPLIGNESTLELLAGAKATG